MRAIVFDQHSPDLNAYRVATDLPEPTPGADEVIVRVAYAALNRLDNFVRIGWKGLDLKLPHIPCSDFAGEIVADRRRGAQLARRPDWSPPTRSSGAANAAPVFAANKTAAAAAICWARHVAGTCAEYVMVPARNLVEIPAGYDLRQAAAASLVYVTAWHNLIVAGALQAGERVLVVGAGGGVNTAAIQIAKLAGAQVYVIASSATKAERRAPLGADWAHDRSTEPDWSRASFRRPDARAWTWWSTMWGKPRGRPVCAPCAPAAGW